MPIPRLKNFLDAHGVAYDTVRHSATPTAQETAASAHVPGKNLAKTVMIKLDGKLAMVVVPATARVDLAALESAVGAEDIELAEEPEFAGVFPDCEPGAMPPFGNLYDLETFVSQELREDEEIAFPAGTHTELVRLRYRDFENLVAPTPIPSRRQPNV